MNDKVKILRLDAELKAAAEKKAASMGLSLSSYIRMLITIDLKKK